MVERGETFSEKLIYEAETFLSPGLNHDTYKNRAYVDFFLTVGVGTLIGIFDRQIGLAVMSVGVADNAKNLVLLLKTNREDLQKNAK